MNDEQSDNLVEREIQDIMKKLHEGTVTEEEWQRFVELTHWEDGDE